LYLNKTSVILLLLFSIPLYLIIENTNSHVRDPDNNSTIVITIEYNLTIKPSTGGSIRPAPGNHSYLEDTVVTVTATPDSGYVLSYWMLDDINVGHENPYSVTMDTTHIINPVFTSQPIFHELTIGTSTDGSTSPTGTHSYPDGSSIDVTAIPDSGFRLSHWILDGVNVGYENPYPVNMDRSHTINAVFTGASSNNSITPNHKGANFYISWSEDSSVPDSNRFATLIGFNVSAEAGCNIVMFGLNPDFWKIPRYQQSLNTFVKRTEALGMGYTFKIQEWGDASQRFSTPGSNYKIVEDPDKRTAALDFWKDIARIYGGRPQFLGISPLNEPYYGSNYAKWDTVIQYYYDVIDTFRSVPGAEYTWVYVQAPYHWAGELTPWLVQGVIDRPNVGYEYHKFFETWHWDPEYSDTYLKGDYVDGRNLMEDWHRINIEPFLDAYPDLLVFAGEFGPLTDEAGYQQAIRDQTDIMEQHGIPWTVMFMKDDFDGTYEKYCYLTDKGTALNEWGLLLDELWDK
jgi:hypothetical protein